MIKNILYIIIILSLLFLEPFLYIPFKISLFLVFSLVYLKNELENSVILIVLGSILLDFGMKLDLGVYLLFVSSVLVIYELGERYSSSGFLLIIIKLFSIFIGYNTLNFFTLGFISIEIAISNLFPAIATYVLIEIISNLMGSFKLSSTGSVIKI